MKFLVSYKVVKRCIQTDKIVENIDSLVLDTRSTTEHPIEFKNVVDEKVLNECGSIIKKHVYKVYGKNEEVGYSNIMALVDYVYNWSPSYL